MLRPYIATPQDVFEGIEYSMFPILGQSLLWVALACAVYSIGATFFAYRAPQARRAAWMSSSARATTALFVALSLAAVVLWYLFLTNDFSVNYVWGHSSKEQPLGYKISAIWGGQGGSLLLWAWLLGLYAVLVARFGRKSSSTEIKQVLVPTAVAVINVVSVFFIGMIALAASPFALGAGPLPKEGLGLNPLLQNYWMQIHPPTLYTGYVGCTVPFAFAMAALLHRRTDGEWLSVVRRWTLFPWVILTIGIIMGGRWAYETLGWGGYWAWDPVENASLLPWLTGTAFIHSIMIQARRGMLKSWNMTLVTLTFLLSVFGTFLTRSGVISSVHSFAESNIGPYFLGFLALALVVSFGIIAWRRDDLHSKNELESPFSREGAFMLNNWILLGATFAVLWGTVYPAISQAINGTTVSVGAPYFNRVMVPLGLILLALTGIGPLMAWRKTSAASLLRVLKWPILAGVVASPLLWVLSQWETGAATAFCLAVFVVFAIGGEFVRGTRARRKMTGEATGTAFVNLIGRNKARYGGYIVHLGIVTLMVGAAGNAFKIETEPITLKKGDIMPIRDSNRISEYALRFEGLARPEIIDKGQEDEVAAIMTVLKNGKAVAQMSPHVDFFKAVGNDAPEARAGQPPQQARRPAIMVTPAHDLYLALTDYDPKANTAMIKAYLNPLVMWIWVSCLFFIGGTTLSLLPDRKRDVVEAEEKAAEPTSANRVLDRTPRGEVLAATAVGGNALSGKEVSP